MNSCDTPPAAQTPFDGKELWGRCPGRSTPADCGMHWEAFDKKSGQQHHCAIINNVLSHDGKRYELSFDGEVVQKPDAGFESLLVADAPSKDARIRDGLSAAVRQYRRRRSSRDDRRQAVRDLADVLEFLKPQAKGLLTAKDDADLFNSANDFGIRHHNALRKAAYDSGWSSWIFYHYLATIHLLIRKVDHGRWIGMLRATAPL